MVYTKIFQRCKVYTSRDYESETIISYVQTQTPVKARWYVSD